MKIIFNNGKEKLVEYMISDNIIVGGVAHLTGGGVSKRFFFYIQIFSIPLNQIY